MDPGLNFDGVGKEVAIVLGQKGLVLSVDEKAGEKEVQLPLGLTFQVIPPLDPKGREILFISGQSGSGKSYFAREYARYYHKLFPKRSVYLISKLTEDETLDELPFLKRIKVETLVSEPIASVDCFKESLIILDDTETLGKEELAAVAKIRNDVCVLSRHFSTSMCVLQHLGTNGIDTRLLLGEAHRFVLFPQSMGTAQFRYLLDRYLGLTKQEIAELRKVRSRWICIGKNFPAYVITQDTAKMLNTK